MKSSLIPLCLLFPCCLLQAVQPNILVLLADDLGYADLGVQGARDIPTPQIDALARNGLRFTAPFMPGILLSSVGAFGWHQPCDLLCPAEARNRG